MFHVICTLVLFKQNKQNDNGNHGFIWPEVSPLLRPKLRTPTERLLRSICLCLLDILAKEGKFIPDSSSSNWHCLVPPLHLVISSQLNKTKRNKESKIVEIKGVLIMTSKYTENLYRFHLFSGITYKKPDKSTWWCSPGPWLDWGSGLRRVRSRGWCWNGSGQAAKIAIQEEEERKKKVY